MSGILSITSAVRPARVVLIGAGVGITPLRALLEDLPATVEVSVIVRASSPGDIVHRDEVAALVARRGGRSMRSLARAVRFDSTRARCNDSCPTSLNATCISVVREVSAGTSSPQREGWE